MWTATPGPGHRDDGSRRVTSGPGTERPVGSGLVRGADGFTASFDTFGACHQMELDPIVRSALIRHVEKQLNETSDERTKTKLESGKELFDKLRTGNAGEGWAVLKPGAPVTNIRVVGRAGLAWRRIKSVLKLR